MYKVILVDDEKWIITSLQHSIPWQEHGFFIVGTSSDGQEALTKISELLPDLVITDVRMPLMDGLELIGQARERWPSIQFIVISGHAEFEYARKAISYGIVSYCLKPVERDEMIEALAEVRSRIELELSQRLYLFQTIIDRQDEKEALRFFGKLGLEWNYCSGMRVICGFAERAFPLDHRSRLFIIAENNLPPVRDNAFNGSLGLSSCIKSPLQLEAAIGEAQIAQQQSFITGKDDVYIYQNPDSSQLRNLLSLIGENHRLNDKTAVSNGLAMLKQLLIEHNHTIKHVFYCYNRLLDMIEEKNNVEDTADVHLNYLESYYELPEMYQNLSDMFAQLTEQLSDQAQQSVRAYDSDSGNSIVRSVIHRLDKEFVSDISLSSLAASHHVTPSHLCRIFKRETGKTLTHHLAELRLNKARNLLRGGSLQVTEIAHNCGYNNYFYFARLFKKMYGMTPTQYRESD